MEDQKDGQVRYPSKQRLSRYQLPSGDTMLIPYRWNGELHGPLLQVIEHLRKKRSSNTYRTYAQQYLNFDSYADQYHQVRWDSEPEKVRDAYIAYLKVVGGAEVTERHGTHVILTDPAQLKRAASTLQLQHEAIRTVYKTATELGIYSHPTDPLSRVVPGELMRDRVPWWSSDPLKAGHFTRDPSRIFRVENGEWTPVMLMSDTRFATHLREAFEQCKYCVDHRLSSPTQRALVCQVKGLSGLQDGKTDPQQFTCQRDQRHFLRFALLNQSAIVRSERIG